MLISRHSASQLKCYCNRVAAVVARVIHGSADADTDCRQKQFPWCQNLETWKRDVDDVTRQLVENIISKQLTSRASYVRT